MEVVEDNSRGRQWQYAKDVGKKWEIKGLIGDQGGKQETVVGDSACEQNNRQEQHESETSDRQGAKDVGIRSPYWEISGGQETDNMRKIWEQDGARPPQWETRCRHSVQDAPMQQFRNPAGRSLGGERNTSGTQDGTNAGTQE